MTARDGYVSVGSKRADLESLICAAAGNDSLLWTVDAKAELHDLVVFYFTQPVSAFVACGKVLGPTPKTHGRSRRRMAQIGKIRLFPRPIPLAEARRMLDASWLRTPQGFGRGQKAGVVGIVRSASR